MQVMHLTPLDNLELRFVCVMQVAAALVGAVALALGSGAAADAPIPWQWNFQDSATSTAQAMQDLHHDVMFFVLTIGFFVLYMTGMVRDPVGATAKAKLSSSTAAGATPGRAL